MYFIHNPRYSCLRLHNRNQISVGRCGYWVHYNPEEQMLMETGKEWLVICVNKELEMSWKPGEYSVPGEWGCDSDPVQVMQKSDKPTSISYHFRKCTSWRVWESLQGRKVPRECSYSTEETSRHLGESSSSELGEKEERIG